MGLPLLPFFLSKRGRKVWDDSTVTFLSEIRSNVRVIATSLTRIMELKSNYSVREEELNTQLNITLSEFRDLRDLLENDKSRILSLNGDLYNAVKIMEAYSVISDREGVKFLVENTERILRAARWCDGSLTKFLRIYKKYER